MAIERWSDKVLVVRLGDDPQFADDLESLHDLIHKTPADMVMDFAAVGYINSSNISRLLALRNEAAAQGRRMILCQLGTQVQSALLMTALDRVFEISQTVPTALATLMMG